MGKLLTLTERTARAVGFRITGSVLDVALSVGLGIILARILPPEEFGLFAITVSIVAIGEVLGSCGMLGALVQRKDLTPGHEAAAAIFQFSSAVLLSGLLFFGAAVATRLFGMPGLEIIMRVESAVLLINAMGLLPESRLYRRLAFDRLTAIQVSSRAVGGGVAIFLAMRGLGALALAIGSLTTALARTLLLWICARGFIPLAFKHHHFRELISFGSGILLTNISNTLAQRLDVLIIGRQVGSEAVGLYQRATQLALLPLSQVTGSTNKVLFPAMSSVQDEHVRFQRGYLGTVRLSALVAFPLLTGLWASADIIVPFVYGPMWEGAVPILQILAIAGFFRILANSQALVAQARGQARAEAARQALWLVLVVVFAFLGSRAGVLGVAIGISVATFLFLISMTRLALPIAGVLFVDWLNAMRTGILGSISMGLAILLTKNLFHEHLPTVLLLLLTACTGLFFYIAVIRFCLSRDDNEFVDLVCRILPLRLGALLRSLLGITSRSSMQEGTGKVPA